MNTCAPSSAELSQHIAHAITAAGGWLGFDRFMHLALYAPGLGYYANDSLKLGAMPADGSDFVTAPELSSLYGQTLAAQVIEALQHTATHEVWEFGAGSGALAEQVLTTLQAQGVLLERYTIVDVSGSLRQRQQARLAAFGDVVQWADHLPPAMHGVVLGNEVLDAMPVQLLARIDGTWHERGVALGDGGAFIWSDRPTPLRPPLRSRANTITSPKSTPRAKPLSAPWATIYSAARRFSLTTVLARTSTTTPSAPWAPWSATSATKWTATRWPTWAAKTSPPTSISPAAPSQRRTRVLTSWATPARGTFC